MAPVIDLAEFRRRETGMFDMAVVCHPSRKTQAEEFAAQISASLDRGDTLGVVCEDRCPAAKFYLVNRDFYDHFGADPWDVVA